MSVTPRTRSYRGGGNRIGGIERSLQALGRRWLTTWPRQAWDMPLALPSRRHTQVILGVGVLIAAVNLWIVLQADLDWVWADGRARLTIARSIIDNKQPGFTQFGNTCRVSDFDKLKQVLFAIAKERPQPQGMYALTK